MICRNLFNIHSSLLGSMVIILVEMKKMKENEKEEMEGK
jgi:hypothetical protein